MKFLLLSLIMLGVSFNSISQDIKKELQSSTWHGQGWFKDKTLSMSKTNSKSEWQLKFLSTGLAKYIAIVKEKGYDENSKVVMPGDTVRASYKYQVKKDVIYFDAPHGKYYFKIIKLPNNEGLELTSATEADFK